MVFTKKKLGKLQLEYRVLLSFVIAQRCHNITRAPPSCNWCRYIVVWWVFYLNSLNLEVYLNTPSIVCLRIYGQVIYNGRSNDTHVNDFDTDYLLSRTIWVRLYQGKPYTSNCLILSITTFTLMSSFSTYKVNWIAWVDLIKWMCFGLLKYSGYGFMRCELLVFSVQNLAGVTNIGA